jgi:NAD(P)-dependent dehydrogenase (short-subunit alcohol dehydrogenase family)
MTDRLNNKIAIITGSGSGIGEATAKLFAEEGAKVVIAEINSENGKKVSDEINDKGSESIFIETDVSQSDSVKSMVDQTVSKLGTPDILINNAGIAVFDDPLELSDENWKKCFSVDLDGVWFGCKHTLPFMLEKKKGSIVNIASVHSFQIIPKTFPYPVAKHGVLGLTRALAVDYASKGIKINAISPGYIFTPINEWFFNTKPDPIAAKKEAEMHAPINRLGASKEIANAALFMSSDECNFMVGANVVIDGGLTLKIHDN